MEEVLWDKIRFGSMSPGYFFCNFGELECSFPGKIERVLLDSFYLFIYFVVLLQHYSLQ